MNQSDAQTVPNYVTCPCQYCSGKIEFDANQLDPAQNTTVPCPHCGLETIIFIPEQRVPPVIPPVLPANEPQLDSPEVYWMVLKWYRKAAEQGDPEYQCQLAMELIRGRGLAQDYAEAAEWFLKAAAQGQALAQFNVGVCYWNGHGLAKDHAEGVKWFLKAAEQGDAGAQNTLSACYEKGDGLDRNYVEAYKWAKLAAAQNEEGARERCDELASKMSKEQIEESQKRIEAFEPKLNDVSKPHQGSILDLWRRFAEAGDIEAQQLLAHRCGDQVEAMKWLRRSAEQGSALAQYRLGVAHSNGEGVRQDFAEAISWFRKAAEKEYVPALYELGLERVNTNAKLLR